MWNISRSHKRTLSLQLKSDLQANGILPPPPGWKLFRATKWPIIELGLSAETFGGSSFEVVPLWVPETGQFSAVKGNFSILDSDGVKRLQTLQPSDGYTLRVKMNWLVASGIGVAPMWTHSPAEWDQSPTYEVGTMLWGDQIFAASEDVFYLATSIGYGGYRKVLPFRRADWSKDPKQYPYLFPRATICRANGGISNDFGRGEIRTMLQVLDARDYKFAGGQVPGAFYIPVQWCQAYP